jgi:23S rRNA (cytosine1962-C5)-methyltransferase
MGGAQAVHNIDSSEAALALCRKNAELNRISPESMTTLCADVFQYLSNDTDEKFDMVILDPPALIKAKGNFDAGRKAHHFLNRAAMRLVRDGGLFVTSSCSSFFNEDDLSVTLRRASVQNNLHLDLRHSVRQSPDHPISLYFPESFYLKSLICQVRK